MQAVKLVNNIIIDEQADATVGKKPSSNISGVVIIPPPSPNKPAKSPADTQKQG